MVEFSSEDPASSSSSSSSTGSQSDNEDDFLVLDQEDVENELVHLGIPVPGLMTEMRACLKQLLDSNRCINLLLL